MNDDLNNLFNGGDMSDEEFRRLFTRIMNQKQRDMEEFMRKFYGSSLPFGFMPFGFLGNSGMTRNDSKEHPAAPDNDPTSDMLRNLMRYWNNTDDMDIENGTDEFGNPWENKSWSSPDGSMSFHSSSRLSDFTPEEIEGLDGYFPGGEKEDPLEVLKKKMAKAVKEQKYEEAAKFRDAIKTLEENNKEGES